MNVINTCYLLKINLGVSRVAGVSTNCHKLWSADDAEVIRYIAELFKMALQPNVHYHSYT
jgi:hypothetical protein